MEGRISVSVVVKFDEAGMDLAPLAGMWDSGLSVRLTNPATVTKGPVVILGAQPPPTCPPPTSCPDITP